MHLPSIRPLTLLQERVGGRLFFITLSRLPPRDTRGRLSVRLSLGLLVDEFTRKFSCKRAQSRTIALSQMSKIEFTRILPWRAIALLRTCSGYAERSRIFVQASAIELAHIAERSRKSQKQKSRSKQVNELGRAVSPVVAHSPGQRPG